MGMYGCALEVLLTTQYELTQGDLFTDYIEILTTHETAKDTDSKGLGHAGHSVFDQRLRCLDRQPLKPGSLKLSCQQ